MDVKVATYFEEVHTLRVFKTIPKADIVRQGRREWGIKKSSQQVT